MTPAERITLALLALAVSACSRADDATTLPPQSAAERPAYVAPSVTPLPPPTWTPHVQMTRQSVEATAIYLQAEQQRVDHDARLYAITERAAADIAAADVGAANSRATQAAVERDNAAQMATATVQAVSARATLDTAMILTALPAKATQVRAEAQGAETWQHLPGFLGVGLGLALVVIVYQIVRAISAENKRRQEQHNETIRQSAHRRYIERMQVEYATRARAPMTAAAQPETRVRDVHRTRNGKPDAPMPIIEHVDRREKLWRHVMVRTLEWAQALGGLTQSVLLAKHGGPFKSPEDWQEATDALAANGYVVKKNGDRGGTALAERWQSYTAAIADIETRTEPTTHPDKDPIPVGEYAPAPARV